MQDDSDHPLIPRQMAQSEALEAYQAGTLTLREFARALGIDVWGAHDLLVVKGVPTAQGVRAASSSGLHELVESIKRRG